MRYFWTLPHLILAKPHTALVITSRAHLRASVAIARGVKKKRGGKKAFVRVSCFEVSSVVPFVLTRVRGGGSNSGKNEKRKKRTRSKRRIRSEGTTTKGEPPTLVRFDGDERWAPRRDGTGPGKTAMLHPKNPKRSPQEALLFYQQQQQQQKKEKQQNQQQQQKRGRSMASDPCSLSDGDYGSFSCSKRLRRPNFKFQELEMMVSLLEERPELASGKIGGAYINADAQRQAWQELATLIGAVGEVQRSAREIREKWIDYKSRVKQKLRKIRDQEEGHAEPGALPTTLTPLELRIIDLAKRNARHCNEDPDLYINCYEGPEPTTTHGSYQHPECPSFKATTGNFTGSKSQDTRQKQSLLHPELTINLLDDDRSGEDDDVEDEEELVEDDDEEEDVETDLQTQRLQSRSNKDSNGAPATTMVDSKPIIMTPSPELVPNDATPMVLSSANGPSSRTHSEFQGYSRDSSESSFTALTNEDDGGGDSSAVAATSAPEEFQGTLTERLLSHLAHKQDRVVGLLTELTEETYRRRTIEEETLGLLRTLVALQARRVELEELKMGLSSEELTRRTMTNHSAAQGSRTSK